MGFGKVRGMTSFALCEKNNIGAESILEVGCSSPSSSPCKHCFLDQNIENWCTMTKESSHFRSTTYINTSSQDLAPIVHRWSKIRIKSVLPLPNSLGKRDPLFMAATGWSTALLNWRRENQLPQRARKAFERHLLTCLSNVH